MFPNRNNRRNNDLPIPEKKDRRAKERVSGMKGIPVGVGTRKRVCNIDGCTNYSRNGAGRCLKHSPQYEIPVDISEGTALDGTVDDTVLPVDTVLSVQEARKHDQAVMQVDEKPNVFRAPVCVVCDRLIIGCETVHKITSEKLISQGSRIGVRNYEDYHQVTLKEDLICQYQIRGLEGLLLSPRAKSSVTMDGAIAYDACTQCASSLETKSDSPPKYAIANGFAIGNVPENIILNEDVTEEMCSLLSPMRPFAYIFAYSAGAHKSIRGHFSFFEVNLTHTGAVMNHFLETGANPMVYAILCGRMTPKQKQIVKDRVRFDTSKMIKLIEWFVRESGHPAYNHVTPPSECPRPTIIVDEETNNNTDQEQDPEVERSFAGASFHFTSTHEPQPDTGVHDTNQKFVKAMLERTMPTLLVTGGNFADLRELVLENVAPLQFPFGQGGPKVKRRNRISLLETYRHYCRLSLQQFMRGDFLLILNHMYNRLRSYTTAMITCRSNIFGRTLAERMSTLKLEDLQRAVHQKEIGQKVCGVAGDYLNSIEASCKPVGYCALNAKVNRRRHFAMDNYFGGHSIFLTTTPCDECTIRVQLFSNAGKEISLPNLQDFDDNEHMGDCLASFELRKRTRRLYPGACSLVYQHLMQIVTECLIGWDQKTQTGRLGVFGVPLAYSRTDEEQGRKTIHSHWQIWIQDFNKTRNALFHSDKEKRKSARDALISYIDKVVCASYGTDFVVTHRCTNAAADSPVTKPMSEILQEAEDKNIIRKAQHQDHCLDIKGRVLTCIECEKSFSTSECVIMGVNHLRQQEQQQQEQEQEEGKQQEEQEQEEGEQTLSSSQIRKEWLDHAVIRFPYDFDQNGKPTKALEEQSLVMKDGAKVCRKWLHDYTLRRDLLHFRFDEHACTHRGTCFKKKTAECRANLPEMASNKSVIFDNEEIETIKDALQKQNDTILNNNEEKQVFWHYLDGKVERTSQYTILPKRSNGSQFLNQHNIPISSFIGCNTNITMGDPSHTYYTTLYKTKDTQAEDKEAYHRVIASMGRRLWRQEQQRQQDELQQLNGDSTSSAQQEQEECHIEGLGRVITGMNALLSRDVVSSTMAHLLISQGGERFTYSHGFSNLLLHNFENVIEEKETVDFRLRTNWDKNENKSISWPDCTANDYIYRPIELENLCLYEYTMYYEKIYKTFKEINNENVADNNKTYKFIEGHPGQNYCHLIRRRLAVIPIISTRQGGIGNTNVSLLQVSNETPSPGTKMLRERYAKEAMMLFYPIRRANDLLAKGTYWQTFVDIGGTTAPRDKERSNSQHHLFWNQGRMILENIQTRATAEKEMKRPERKITFFTEMPKCTGKRKERDVDSNDYDMDIDELYNDDDDDGDGMDMNLEATTAAEPRYYTNTDLRSHKGLMDRADVSINNMIGVVVDANTSVLASEQARKSSGADKASDSKHNKRGSHAPQFTKHKYDDLLTFIQGSLLASGNKESNPNGSENIDMDEDATSTTTLEKETNSEAPTQQQKQIPKLHDVASQYNLDPKQYIAYQIVCCTFLLQLVNEGNHYDTELGKMFHMTLGTVLTDDTRERKDKLVKELKSMGAKEQLVMFLSGAAGCGKSTTMQAAQLYAHRFCTAIAAVFNDYSFYFTATTGSAAALYGGTTIHSAAHLNRTKLTDEMRAIWREDVRILIIDEISFFTASDVARLDRQLKKLTGRHDIVYGGVSIVFSGDFHQLKPICAEDDVLYSDSDTASLWENTINCAIFLDNSHRFKDDPLYGEILARMRMGEDTLADRQEINKRVVGARNSLALPEYAPDACFACSTNKERNGVTAGSFKVHIQNTHPNIDEESLPPDHTLIIEASVSTKGPQMSRGQKSKKKKRKCGRTTRKVSTAVHETIIATLGDDDIRGTGGNGVKIEPALRLYPGSHHMCITNEDLDKGRGNGTICKCLRVKLMKDGQERRWKNWDGKKVWTVSADDVEWVEFEHYPVPSGTRARTFRLKPQEFAATIKFPLNEDITVKLGNAKVKQIPVNSNIATTGHKLQGMSKDIIIVNNWNYRCVNWVYVVLSRVRTLAGLYLMKPLDLERSFNVPHNLIRFERRLKQLKETPILQLLGYVTEE